MGLGFEVHWLDRASVAFILLCWLFGVEKKRKRKKVKKKKKIKKNEEKKKKKSLAHFLIISLVFGFSMV